MPVSVGSRVGAYEIQALLGVGGMGEVFRARDTRLERDVAIKVILDAFAAEPDRIARFEREARILASLNHPHIAAIYGLERSEGQHFLIMELVEGDTLADRIARGPLPLADALPLAVQIADSLAAAHEKGIVHRDLKPANIKITADDRVKVLDFGLAKALEPGADARDPANSPTISLTSSQAGMLLGTAQYMAPEQVKGLPADHRSDLFAFGVVLLEMLTGRAPFEGNTIPEILASILVHEPDYRQLPPGTDPRVVALLRRCLDKAPKRRWQAAGDLRFELEEVAQHGHVDSALSTGAAPSASWRRRSLGVAGFTALAAIAWTASTWLLKPALVPGEVRFGIVVPAVGVYTGAGRNVVAISPDGSAIAYVAESRIYLRRLDQFQSVPIAGTDTVGGVTSPVFSPDSRSIAYVAMAENAIKAVSLSGGRPVTLCAATNPFGLSWGPQGIVFAESGPLSSPEPSVQLQRRGIVRIAPDGGTPEVLIPLQSSEFADTPQVLPDGDSILFTLASASGAAAERWDRAAIVVQSRRTGVRTRILDGGTGAKFIAPRHLAYAVGGNLFVVDFDPASLRLTGTAYPVVEGVRRSVGVTSGMADFGVSETGTLVFVPGPSAATTGNYQFVLASVTGEISPLPLPPGLYKVARTSPDGTRIAFENNDAQNAFVGVADVSGATAPRRVTFGGTDRYPVWSQDGRRLFFQSRREGDFAVFEQPADGSAEPRRLTRPRDGEAHVPQSSANGVLLYDVVKGDQVVLWELSLKDQASRPYGAVSSTTLTSATFSRDGRWVAYAVSEGPSTHVALYVQPYPADRTKHLLITPQEGQPHHPIWAPDGRRLFYIPRPGAFESVTVTTTPEFAFGNPVSVPRQFQAGGPGSERMFDMMPDGRVLSFVPAGIGTIVNNEIRVVLNWQRAGQSHGGH